MAWIETSSQYFCAPAAVKNHIQEQTWPNLEVQDNLAEGKGVFPPTDLKLQTIVCTTDLTPLPCMEPEPMTTTAHQGIGSRGQYTASQCTQGQTTQSGSFPQDHRPPDHCTKATTLPGPHGQLQEGRQQRPQQQPQAPANIHQTAPATPKQTTLQQENKTTLSPPT